MSEETIDISFFTSSFGFSVDTQYSRECIVFNIKSRFPCGCIPDSIDISDVSIFGEPFYKSIFLWRNIME